jgi:hypothetical protein
MQPEWVASRGKTRREKDAERCERAWKPTSALSLMTGRWFFFFEESEGARGSYCKFIENKRESKVSKITGKNREQRAKHSHSHSQRREISGNTEGEKEN